MQFFKSNLSPDHRKLLELMQSINFGRIENILVEDGRIDLDRLTAKLALLRGQMSAVLISRRDPGTVFILKGDKPLSLWMHRQHSTVIYASEEAFLREALSGEKGWCSLAIPPLTLVAFDSEAIRDFNMQPFHFTIQSRQTIITRGISI